MRLKYHDVNDVIGPAAICVDQKKRGEPWLHQLSVKRKRSEIQEAETPVKESREPTLHELAQRVLFREWADAEQNSGDSDRAWGTKALPRGKCQLKLVNVWFVPGQSTPVLGSTVSTRNDGPRVVVVFAV